MLLFTRFWDSISLCCSWKIFPFLSSFLDYFQSLYLLLSFSNDFLTWIQLATLIGVALLSVAVLTAPSYSRQGKRSSPSHFYFLQCSQLLSFQLQVLAPSPTKVLLFAGTVVNDTFLCNSRASSWDSLYHTNTLEFANLLSN